MLLVQHAASPALARNPDESFAIGARRIDFVIDERFRRVTDSEARVAEPLGHLGFLFMPARARTEPLVEGANLLESISAKGHIRTEHSAHFDNFVAVVGDRQVEVRRHRSDSLIGIFDCEDSPLHSSEFAMSIKKLLDRPEVARRDGEVVVEEHQDLPRRLGDCAILDAAFSGARFMQMRER